MSPNELKNLLAANLERLLEFDAVQRGERLSHEKLAAKARVGKGTVGRIARKGVAPGVDTLESVAKVFGLQAWQLLCGAVDPEHPPRLLTRELEERLMTPELEAELVELRAIRAQLEALASGRGRETGAGSGDPPDRQTHLGQSTSQRKPPG